MLQNKKDQIIRSLLSDMDEVLHAAIGDVQNAVHAIDEENSINSAIGIMNGTEEWIKNAERLLEVINSLHRNQR